MTSEQEQKAEDEGIVGQSASTAGLGVEEIMDMVDAVCDATLNAFGNDRMSINIADGFVAKIKRDELRAALALSLKAPNVKVQGQDEAQLRTVPLERPVGREEE